MRRVARVLGACLRAGVLLAALLAAACGYRPRAPALTDGSVYRNDREGFRFLVPEGWVQQAKGDVPPGPADQERLLVVYRNFTGERPAALEVSLAHLPESTDLGKHLEGSAPLGVRWRRVGPPETLEVHGA